MPPKHFKFANLHTLDLWELVLQPRGLGGSSSSSLQAWWCWGAGETSHQAQLCGGTFLPVELPCVPAVAQTSGAGGQHHLELDRDQSLHSKSKIVHPSRLLQTSDDCVLLLHQSRFLVFMSLLVLLQDESFGQQHRVHSGAVIFGAPFHALQTVWVVFPGLPLSFHWTICPWSCFWPAWLCWHGGDRMHSIFCR